MHDVPWPLALAGRAGCAPCSPNTTVSTCPNRSLRCALALNPCSLRPHVPPHAGDRLNLAKNQTVLRNTTAFPWVPLDTPVTVQPVLSSVVLTNPTTLEVKLPLSSTFTAANTTVCNSALQLWPANGTAAKADFAFTACSLKDLTTLVLNLPAGSYSPGGCGSACMPAECGLPGDLSASVRTGRLRGIGLPFGHPTTLVHLCY